MNTQNEQLLKDLEDAEWHIYRVLSDGARISPSARESMESQRDIMKRAIEYIKVTETLKGSISEKLNTYLECSEKASVTVIDIGNTPPEDVPKVISETKANIYKFKTDADRKRDELTLHIIANTKSF